MRVDVPDFSSAVMDARRAIGLGAVDDHAVSGGALPSRAPRVVGTCRGVLIITNCSLSRHDGMIGGVLSSCIAYGLPQNID